MEEISLKELIGILYKYKVIIIGVVIAALAFSLVYCFFIAVPMYDAYVEIEINSMNTGVQIFEQENHPTYVANELIEHMETPQFMDDVSKVIAGKNIQIRGTSLEKILSSSKGKDGKSIRLSAKYSVKKDVANIANAAAETLIEYSTQYLKERIEQQTIIIEDKMKLGRLSAEEALTQYKKYLSGSESLSKLQLEIDLNETLFAQLKANLISGSIGAGKSKAQLEQDITVLENKIRQLNDKLIDEKLRDRLYDEELKSSLRAYTAHKDEYDRLKLAERYLDAKSNANILLYAKEPVSAGSPDRKRIITISLYAGICIGVFIAFAIEYLKRKK